MTDEPREEEELDLSGDDQSIGRAFRASMIVFVILGAIGGVIWWSQRPSEDGGGPVDDAPIEGPTRERRVSDPPAVKFVDVTAAAGLDFVHFNGATGEKWLPETMGGGCAFFDYDRDGDPDLFLVNGTSWDNSRREPSRLYRNDGQGQFEDVTAEVGLADTVLYGMGVATGDYDGDGWIDLYLTAVGPNRMLRNVDGKRFEDVTVATGVAGEDDRWSSSAAFLDIENDGDLDLFVCNYIEWSREIDAAVDFQLTGVGRAYGPPTNFGGTESYLFVNDGAGKFEELGGERGIHVANDATGRPVGKALAVCPADVDRDGDLDLFVANDTVRNFLFRNEGDGSFSELGEDWALAYDINGAATGAMGVDFGFYRNDDTVGLAVGNFANEMTSLYVASGGEMIFSDEAVVEGIGATSRKMLTFGLFFFDYDLDRRLDFLQVNGHLEEEINKVQASQRYRQPAQMFWNTGRASAACFVPVKEAGDLSKPIVGRGAAYADIDGDGDLDVLLTQIGGAPLLVRNDQALGHHWLRLRLSQAQPNTGAIGAVVTVHAGGDTMTQTVMPARSYQSQVELPLTFGLGDATKVDRVVVRWPDGTTEERTDLAIDQEHAIVRP